MEYPEINCRAAFSTLEISVLCCNHPKFRRKRLKMTTLSLNLIEMSLKWNGKFRFKLYDNLACNQLRWLSIAMRKGDLRQLDADFIAPVAAQIQPMKKSLGVIWSWHFFQPQTQRITDDLGAHEYLNLQPKLSKFGMYCGSRRVVGPVSVEMYIYLFLICHHRPPSKLTEGQMKRLGYEFTECFTLRKQPPAEPTPPPTK